MRTSDEGSRSVWGVNCSCFSTCMVLGGASEAEEHRAVPPFFITIMAKKDYKKPSTEVFNIQPLNLLAESGGTGASGGDVPWGVKQNFESLNDFSVDYDEN